MFYKDEEGRQPSQHTRQQGQLTGTGQKRDEYKVVSASAKI